MVGDMFEIPIPSPESGHSVTVLGSIKVKQSSCVAVSLTWVGDPVKDMVADSLVCLVQQIEENFEMFPSPDLKPPSLLLEEFIAKLLSAQYGEKNVTRVGKRISLQVDETSATIECNPPDFPIVSTANKELQTRVETAVHDALVAFQNVAMPIVNPEGVSGFVKGEVFHPT